MYHYLFLALFYIPFIDISDRNCTSTAEQDFDRNLVIQVGAFRIESNALGLKNRLTDLLDQTIVTVSENDMFKVRITGFKTQEELERTVSSLGLLGLGRVWIMSPERLEPKTLPVLNVALGPDVFLAENKVNQVAVQHKSTPDTVSFALQVGVFHDRSKAIQAQRRIIARFKLPVSIEQEWTFFKVIIHGFSSAGETAKYYPELTKMGYPDILLIRNF
jgi:cell division protein FtsN